MVVPTSQSRSLPSPLRWMWGEGVLVTFGGLPWVEIPGEGSVSVTQGQAEGRLELGMLSPWQSSVRPPPAGLSLVVMRREHPLPTRPIPTAETEPLGVGGGLQLLKWSVSVSAGLWSWTRLGLECLGPRRRCPPGQSIRHSPLASLLIIQGISRSGRAHV